MLERLKRRFKQEKGFTLVELLAVIAILGIILAIAIPTIGSVIDSSKTDADKANRELMENAARLAYVSGEMSGESYDLGDLASNGFLEEIPENPKTDEIYNGSVKKTGDDKNYTFEYESGTNEDSYNSNESE